MKKFIIFFGIAFLSSIGLQAEDVKIETFEQGNVTYSCVETSVTRQDSTFKNGYSDINITNVESQGVVYISTTNYWVLPEVHEYEGTAVSASGFNVDITDFNITLVSDTAEELGTTNPNYADLYSYETQDYKDTMEYVLNHIQGVNNNGRICTIMTYEQASVQSGVTGVTFIKRSSKGKWIPMEYENFEDNSLENDYPDYQKYYYMQETYEYNGQKLKEMTAITAVGFAENPVLLINRIKNIEVTTIADDAFQNNTDLQGITIGENVTNLKASAFKGASNYVLSLERSNEAFTYLDGILYNSEKTEIILASTNVQTQTLSSSVAKIDEYAFYNTNNYIVITSMNENINVEGDQGYKVSFSYPSTTLDIIPTSDEGYKVYGSITQKNIDTLQIKGSYMDFKDAYILGTLNITNKENTLLYFNTTALVYGNKNIINNGTCEKLVVTDGLPFYCPEAFTTKEAYYTRQFTNKWSTLCLPFNVDDVSDYLVLGALANYSDNIFTFNVTDGITANKPYLAKAPNDKFSIMVSTQNTTVPATSLITVNKGDATFQGVYNAQNIVSDDDTFYYGVATIGDVNNIYKFDGVMVNPYRAYLSVPANSLVNNSAVFRFVDAFENEVDSFVATETTGIENVEYSTPTDNIYNINGQRLNKANRGLNIINGRVVINK